jgi:hypothetical protein
MFYVKLVLETLGFEPKLTKCKFTAYFLNYIFFYS